MLSGEQLKRIREMNKITQSQLANYLGVTNRYIIYVERCERYPSQELYDRWLNGLYSDEIRQASRKKVTNSTELEKEKKRQARKAKTKKTAEE